mgnify:CR=1 FL=1
MPNFHPAETSVRGLLQLAVCSFIFYYYFNNNKKNQVQVMWQQEPPDNVDCQKVPISTHSGKYVIGFLLRHDFELVS